ncbi:Suppressor protein stp22 of temperature-sensitive alpha-factor receptor and arginine permease [Oleoguttula sp. CCFEE 5521]
MAQVPEKVLSWLYSVLHEHQDPQRAYSDIAHTLSSFPSLSPRTEVYTYETGGSALLTTVSGTLPVDFRGTLYRFPVKLWIPLSYPQEAPIVYVTPGKEMLVRPGQHVGVDGRVYHPYLRDWSGMWDRASIVNFLAYLQQAFAREPPVISKAQQQQYRRQSPSRVQQPPPRNQGAGAPVLPPKQLPGNAPPVEMPAASTPPPRPPKPGEEPVYAPRVSSRNMQRDGPPLPPLPGQAPSASQYQRAPDPGPNGHAAHAQRPYDQWQSSGQPPPAHYAQQAQPQLYRPQRNGSPVSPVEAPHGHGGHGARHSSQAAQPVYDPRYGQGQPGPSRVPGPAVPPPQTYRQPRGPQHQGQYQQQQLPGPQYAQQYPPQLKSQQPPQDLLSDPFDIPILSSGPAAPAPPIPPNPEREHLLHALSTSLVSQAQAAVSRNLTAIAPLQAQHSALLQAHSALQAELAQLEHLSQNLASNESILYASIADCDVRIKAAKTKPLPPIDEVLVAPNLVSQQLWTLSAEEAACREAMEVLQRALDKGRVGAGEFVRLMRGLGRERFGKMVLARKCARGLGLDVS